MRQVRNNWGGGGKNFFGHHSLSFCYASVRMAKWRNKHWNNCNCLHYSRIFRKRHTLFPWKMWQNVYNGNKVNNFDSTFSLFSEAKFYVLIPQHSAWASVVYIKLCQLIVQSSLHLNWHENLSQNDPRTRKHLDLLLHCWKSKWKPHNKIIL